ncbi:erythromycin esterase family protein [Vibrio kagoshimensis]|uniref:erythromycin esterase family protein n=1 Tax=Vibrio kagoshimensis TaxID=2910244 RepID=UPI003D19C15B
MKKLSLIGLTLLMGCNSDTENITIEHSPLESTSFIYGNSDLRQFVSATAGYDFIGLGEASHQGSKAYSYRARMLKALHEEGNLDFIAFEAGLYDGLAAWQNYLTDEQNLLDAVTGPDANYMFGHRYSAELSHLFNYVDQLPKDTTPLLLIGYDARINSDPGCSVMFDEFENYLVSQSLYQESFATIKSLSPIMMCPWYADRDFTVTDHHQLTSLLSELISTLTTQKELEMIPDYDPTSPREFRNYASFWLQVAKSLSAHSYFQINGLEDAFTDNQSAENIRWLREEWFNLPDSGQTAIWAHNIHAIPIHGSVTDAIHKRYPDKSTYNVIQLTYRGRLAAYTPDSSQWAINTVPYYSEARTVNHSLFSLGFPDTFIDFKSQSTSTALFNQPQTIRFAGGSLPVYTPTSIADGILFIPREVPAVAR